MRTLGDFSRMNSRRCAQKVALCMGEETISYRDLDRISNALGRALASSGIDNGDRVAILAFNCPEYALISQAAAKLGAILVPLNTRLLPHEVGEILRHCEPKILFVEPELLQTAVAASGAIAARPRLALIRSDRSTDDATALNDLLAGARTETFAPLVDPGAPAAIMYTSGTTGAPKGVLISHDKFLRIFLANIVEMDIDEGDVLQLAVPLFHNNGFASVLNPGLVIGATVACYRGSFDPERVLAHIARHRVTLAHWVPTMLSKLVVQADEGGHDVTSLRKIHYGAMPIAPELLAAAQRVFKVDFYQGYGTTDCGKISCLRPEQHLDKAHMTGRPVFNTAMRIVDPEGNDVPVGGIGEIIVDASTSGMMGYWRDEAATREVIRDGWIHSGDMARREHDCFFTLVERKHFMIISGGENIYPREVELVVATHPQVCEVAVFGVPDPVFGEAVCAAIVPLQEARLDAEAIRGFCHGRIAPYKVPRHVVLMDELPRTATGKIAKGELRERFRAAEDSAPEE